MRPLPPALLLLRFLRCAASVAAVSAQLKELRERAAARGDAPLRRVERGVARRAAEDVRAGQLVGEALAQWSVEVVSNSRSAQCSQQVSMAFAVVSRGG